MDIKSLYLKRSNYLEETCLPHISLDCAIFGFDGEKLKVMLLQFKGQQAWSLFGGYMEKNEGIDDAAKRVMNTRIKTERLYFDQFRIFGEPARTKHLFHNVGEALWQDQRFLTIGYYGVVPYTHTVPVMDEMITACEWKDMDNLPEMVIDHRNILTVALNTLRQQLEFKPIAAGLMPLQFTLPELQRLYESILGTTLHRANFWRKMQASGTLKKHDQPRKGGAHKAPHLFSYL